MLEKGGVGVRCRQPELAFGCLSQSVAQPRQPLQDARESSRKILQNRDGNIIDGCKLPQCRRRIQRQCGVGCRPQQGHQPLHTTRGKHIDRLISASSAVPGRAGLVGPIRPLIDIVTPEAPQDRVAS
eukprot:4734753-Prymnesium_polylepis.1